MLDWGARIDELAHKLAHEYAIEDRLAIEILLTGLIHCPRTPSVWLILETDWYSRDCLDGWFSFGESWTPCSLARLRVRSPWRQIEAEITEWLESPSDEHLFIECDYQRYPYFHHLTQAYYLLQRSLRIRTRAARTRHPLSSLDKYNQERMTDELNAATRYVLEDRAQARPADPPRFIEPPNFLYHIELLQKVAPWYPDWTSLVQAFGLIATRRAYLYGRTETDQTDNQAIARVLQDSIPLWIRRALELLVESGRKTNTLEKHMGLEDKTRRSGHGAHRELVRLHRNGIIHWNLSRQSWEIVSEHRERIERALTGKVFE
jgi:hypothetical protein